jgi:CheY-like chemotaxis protein
MRLCVPAIAFSGNGLDSDIRDCLAAGFDVHLVKPVDCDRLIQTITTLVGS